MGDHPLPIVVSQCGSTPVCQSDRVQKVERWWTTKSHEKSILEGIRDPSPEESDVSRCTECGSLESPKEKGHKKATIFIAEPPDAPNCESVGMSLENSHSTIDVHGRSSAPRFDLMSLTVCTVVIRSKGVESFTRSHHN